MRAPLWPTRQHFGKQTPQRLGTWASKTCNNDDKMLRMRLLRGTGVSALTCMHVSPCLSTVPEALTYIGIGNASWLGSFAVTRHFWISILPLPLFKTSKEHERRHWNFACF